MRKYFWGGVLFLVLINLLVSIPPVFAGNYWVDISSKFGRGITDIITSPVEIPCSIAVEVNHAPYQGLFLGLREGTWKMVRRLVNGVSEVGTFVVPTPAELPCVCAERKPLTEPPLTEEPRT